MPRNSLGPKINFRFLSARSALVAVRSPSLSISRLAISAAFGAPFVRSRDPEGPAVRARSSNPRIASGREGGGCRWATQASRALSRAGLRRSVILSSRTLAFGRLPRLLFGVCRLAINGGSRLRSVIRSILHRFFVVTPAAWRCSPRSPSTYCRNLTFTFVLAPFRQTVSVMEFRGAVPRRALLRSSTVFIGLPA